MSELQLLHTKTALDVLDTAVGLMADQALQAMVGIKLGEMVPTADWHSVRDHAERQRWIVTTKNPISGVLKVQITDEGRVARTQM